MNTHKFDVKDAKKYGIEKAILLEHLKFHQEANKGNNNLEFDGKTFAFIKPSTIKEMYPYLNYSSVRRWLKELEDEGIIESIKPKSRGGYHLKYYHVIPIGQNDQSNDQNDQSLNGQNDQSSIVTNVEVPCEGESSDKSAIPTLHQIKEYFRENGYCTDVAERAYNIYSASIEDHPKRKYWRDSRDNIIKNWKLKMQSVWFKEENKISKKSQTMSYHNRL